MPNPPLVGPLVRLWMLYLLVVSGALWPGAAAAQGLGSFVSPGELARAHADLAGLSKCTSCHEAGRGVSAARCLDCHDAIAREVHSGQGFHATLGDHCERCHPDHRGRDFDMVRLDEATFDHRPTGFPLVGAHARAKCADCHEKPGTWRGLAPICTSCHDDPHGAAHSHRTLLGNCEACHSTAKWAALPLPPAVFRHDAAHTDYPLIGAHARIACDRCHAKWRFVPVPHARCTDCHADPHHGRFGPPCVRCHPTPRSWKVAGFDHDQTDFPLQGRHAAVACRACHGDDPSKPVAHASCEDCHADEHMGQFAPKTCADCHTVQTAGFRIPDFDHDRTGWPLKGKHAGVACADCHGTGKKAVYAKLPASDCVSCHQDPHAGRFAPSPCASCHVETDWKQVASFDHDRTDFPLRGAHAAVGCTTCHTGGVFHGLPHATCMDCHGADDPHGTGLAADTCTRCHTEKAWDEMIFDHETTSFALGPGHAAVACQRCHVRPDFTGADPTCSACHQPPAHHFAGACADCHTDSRWTEATLGKLGHAVTGFVLAGRHAQLACVACHAAGRPFSAAGTECVDCHADEDPHRHLLGDGCGECHTPVAWQHSTWRHDQSGWPLRGAHRLAWCDDCHATGYAGTPRDCWRCHENQAPMDVAAHQGPDFRSCDDCHQPFTWTPRGFPH